VGLVQRILESSGIATVTLSWMPELTRAVGVPRLAGISYPLSRPLGRPHDADGQRDVLRATLALLENATGPDCYFELPFVWPETVAQARNASKDVSPAPIVGLLLKQPWLIPRLYSGHIPG
jgi:hypothetical protein